MELDQTQEIPVSTDETEKSEVIEGVYQIDEQGAKSDSETLECFQECAICLEIIYQKDMISLHNFDSTHTCTHIYHEACIELVNIRWCPLCRRPFSTWKLCFPPPKPPEETVDVKKSTSSKPKGKATVARPSTITRISVGATDASRVDAERVRLNARLNFRPSTTAFTSRPAHIYSNSLRPPQGLPEPERQPPQVTRRSQRLPQPPTVQSTPPHPPQPPTPSLLSSPSLHGSPPPPTIVFPLELLKSTTLPAGVDPKQLESYLSAEDFQSTFKMSRDMFARLSKGQKIVLRRRNGLHR